MALIDQIKPMPKFEVLPSGFSGIDRTRCLKKNRAGLILFCARPGLGKTMLALQIAYTVGKEAPVKFFSLEMSKEELKERLVAMDEYCEGESHLDIEDDDNFNVKRIVENTLKEHKETPYALVVVDYTQIVPSYGLNQKEKVGTVAKELKRLSKRIGAPVIGICQLNRQIEAREVAEIFMPPMMSDIADSDDLAKWADSIIIMHKEPNKGDIIKASIPKNRGSGSKSKIPFELVQDENTGKLRDNDNF